MNQIFKAMCYRIVKSRIMVYSVIFSIMFGLALPFVGVLSEDIVQGMYGTIDNIVFLGNLLFMIFICMYNCLDFKNKTINYEIMNGHKRTDIFWGRMLALTLFVELLFHIMLLCSNIILFTMEEYKIAVCKNGPLGLKLLSLELIIFAYICFYIICTFIINNAIVCVLAGWMGFAFSGLVVLCDTSIEIAGVIPSALVGANVAKHTLLDSFSYTQCMISTFLAVLFSLAFCICGIFLFKRRQF